jgi:predicted ATPase/transcriptional regulator with XRE-family HTH domain
MPLAVCLITFHFRLFAYLAESGAPGFLFVLCGLCGTDTTYARRGGSTEPTVRREEFGWPVAAYPVAAVGGQLVTDKARTERQRRARERLETARESIRRERAEVMARMGRELYAWRKRTGIQQQALAAEGLVSATVVRRIEKGDYESPPLRSLITAVENLGGPYGELEELAATYRTLQARQRHIDQLLSRNEVPDNAGWLEGKLERADLPAGLRPTVSFRLPSLFVGRREELTSLAQLLAGRRLVTVVGPGGIGKTALCLRFAESLPVQLAGCWFADLSRVPAGEPVLRVLADLILDDVSSAGDDAEVVAALGVVLADTPALVILDNCEHVTASAAAAVMRILSACPGVRILATSREPLHLPDEWVMTVGPLPVANRDPQGRLASGPGDAVELFIRLLGQARGEEPELSSAEAAEVADLCRALDGVPLCIELAAARARTLSVRDIAESVGRGLAILSGGRQAIPRHRAIDAAISWSWNLLEPDEQRALSRLAILTSPFTFRCGAIVAHEELDAGERLVATLADKSLVSHDTDDKGDTRFKVLSVVRNFAVRYLSPADRRDAARQLMSWTIHIAQLCETEFQQPEKIERLDAEFALMRIALEAAEESPADQVRVAVAIWPYWHIRSLSAYGCRFLAKAGEERTPLTLSERGKAHGILANLLAYQGRYAESIDAAQRSVQVRRDLGDPGQLRNGLLTLLGCLIEGRRFDQADLCLAEIAAIPGPIDLSAVGDLNVRQGLLYLHRGDPRRAIRLLTEAARCFSIERMTLAHGFCLGYLSVAQRRAGDLEASLRIALEAKELLGSTFGPSCEAEVTVGLAAAYLALGSQQDALAALDAMPVDEQIRPQTRVHALALRAMAACAAAPSAAAAFLLAHTGEFLGGRDEQAMLFIRATQEVAYRSAAYENAALLLGILMRLGTDTKDVEVGLPAFDSSRLQRHLPQSVLDGLMAGGFETDPGTASRLAVVALTEIAADRRAPLSRRSTLDASVTFGTRLMLIAPHSPAPS